MIAFTPEIGYTKLDKGREIMEQKSAIKLFEDKKIRTAWDEEQEKWYFSIVDTCKVLSDPELTINRALEGYLKLGYSREWINQRASGDPGAQGADRRVGGQGCEKRPGVRDPDRRDHQGMVWHDHQAVQGLKGA